MKKDKKDKAVLSVIDKDTVIDTTEKPKPKKPDPSKHYETPWEGWRWIYGLYLVDPEGNRYSQEMVRSSFFTSQLKRDLTGSELKVRSLKLELEKRLNGIPLPEVIIRWNGEETVVRLPNLSFK